MELYCIDKSLRLVESVCDTPMAAVLTSKELDALPPGLPNRSMLVSPHGARFCKAENHKDHLVLTISAPAPKGGSPIVFSCTITETKLVFVDDNGTVSRYLKRITNDRVWKEPSCGVLLYDLLELMIARDARRLEEIEDQVVKIENSMMSGGLEGLSRHIMVLRKQLVSFYRYYSQLDSAVCELEENENSFFSENEVRLFHLCDQRVVRLRDECQILREYCLQVLELFQTEIDLRQNQIMRILTVVTAIFLPLTLVAGWYGMNFVYMPELHWRYGYLYVIILSVLIAILCFWLFRKKKYW